jgi:uncharacterized membrane protein
MNRFLAKVVYFSSVVAVALSLQQAFAGADTVTRCLGTEPFWNLDIGASKIKFSTFEPSAMTIAKPAVATARGASASYIALYQGRLIEDSSRFMNVIIKDETCSDGMSDTIYNYSVLVLSGKTLYSGCCL